MNSNWIRRGKGPTGTCNICGEECKLTEDHVPPKGCGGERPVEAFRIHHLINNEDPLDNGEHYHKGIAYRSLCKRCNNVLLGGEYDPHFIKLSNELSNRLYHTKNTKVTLLPFVKPNRVARAVVGHLLAASPRDANTLFDNELKSWFLNPESILPDNIKIHYWFFPYEILHIVPHTVLFKPIGIMFKLSICKVLKYYPIGFIISYDPIIYDIPSLSELCSSNIDDEAYLQFPLIYFQEPRWPVCASSGYHYILSRSEESSVYGTYTE